VCVRARVCVCVRVCARACVRVCVRARARAQVVRFWTLSRGSQFNSLCYINTQELISTFFLKFWQFLFKYHQTAPDIRLDNFT